MPEDPAKAFDLQGTLARLKTAGSTRRSLDLATPKSRRRSGQFTPLGKRGDVKRLEPIASRIVEKEERATGHVELRMYMVSLIRSHDTTKEDANFMLILLTLKLWDSVDKQEEGLCVPVELRII